MPLTVAWPALSTITSSSTSTHASWSALGAGSQLRTVSSLPWHASVVPPLYAMRTVYPWPPGHGVRVTVRSTHCSESGSVLPASATPDTGRRRAGAPRRSSRPPAGTRPAGTALPRTTPSRSRRNRADAWSQGTGRGGLVVPPGSPTVPAAFGGGLVVGGGSGMSWGPRREFSEPGAPPFRCVQSPRPKKPPCISNTRWLRATVLLVRSQDRDVARYPDWRDFALPVPPAAYGKVFRTAEARRLGRLGPGPPRPTPSCPWTSWTTRRRRPPAARGCRRCRRPSARCRRPSLPPPPSGCCRARRSGSSPRKLRRPELGNVVGSARRRGARGLTVGSELAPGVWLATDGGRRRGAARGGSRPRRDPHVRGALPGGSDGIVDGAAPAGGAVAGAGRGQVWCGVRWAPRPHHGAG